MVGNFHGDLRNSITFAVLARIDCNKWQAFACDNFGDFRKDIPFVFRKRIYALAAVTGSAVYYLLSVCVFKNSATGEIISSVIGMLIVFIIRVLATVFKWNMPKAIDFAKIYAERDAKESENAENTAKV